MADADLVRECVLASLKMQISFRQVIQRNLKNNAVDLTFEMLQLLFCLWEEEGANQQELAHKTFKDKVSMSYLINNLEKKGLVCRCEDTRDRRNKRIYLTPEGRQLREAVYPLLTDIYTSAGQKIRTASVQAATRYLQQLHEIFNEL
ncbi:MAG: MarR family transcriptional regulator [Parabacteroides sp.]|nr:MarR family transcriptional regulator [Parabacteroides sp.]